MRLVAITFTLLGTFLVTGCAMQAGDPADEALDRPGETIAAPAAAAPKAEPHSAVVTTVLPSAQTGAASQDPTSGAGTALPRASGPARAAVGSILTPSGGAPLGDNPNPSPWYGQAPTAAPTGGVSASGGTE